MTTLAVVGGRRLEGTVTAPADKSISHRASILAALGSGPCRISPLSEGADNRSTQAALRSMGVLIEGPTVHGVGGPSQLQLPSVPIDCGNSGTTMRLLAGVLAASRGRATLTGDVSLCGRPMSRLAPLQTMGAQLSGVERGGKLYPPLTIAAGATTLVGQTHDLAIASAQVKSAIMLAALWADGPTVIREPGRSRDHTERMLRGLGVSVEEAADGALTVTPISRPWTCSAIEVAPDMSSAAFMLGAALITGSRDLGVVTAVNPTRTGFLDALEAFGARVVREPMADVGWEPVARVHIQADNLRGTTIAGDLTLRAIDEIPLLAGLAAFVPGRTIIRDAGELRVKESDRLATTCALLTAFGATVEQTSDGLIIDGDRDRLHPATVDAGHDHRIGLTAAVMGLGLPGCSRVTGSQIIDVSYPAFAAHVHAVGGEVTQEADVG